MGMAQAARVAWATLGGLHSTVSFGRARGFGSSSEVGKPARTFARV